jgi:hypothetical protein
MEQGRGNARRRKRTAKRRDRKEKNRSVATGEKRRGKRKN